MSFNLNFNSMNRNTNQTPKFNTKNYNLNSNQNGFNSQQKQMYKSVTGKSYENYENVRIENQRFLNELSNKKNVQ